MKLFAQSTNLTFVFLSAEQAQCCPPDSEGSREPRCGFVQHNEAAMENRTWTQATQMSDLGFI